MTLPVIPGVRATPTPPAAASGRADIPEARAVTAGADMEAAAVTAADIPVEPEEE